MNPPKTIWEFLFLVSILIVGISAGIFICISIEDNYGTKLMRHYPSFILAVGLVLNGITRYIIEKKKGEVPLTK